MSDLNFFQFILIPLSWLYCFGVIIRNWCYDTGIFKAVQVGIPVISVGNITAGGTGKTPMVEYLIRYFLKQNRKIAVLSRGYKRTTKGTKIVSDGNTLSGTAETIGDEPFQIAKKFPSVIVAVDENRARVAKKIVEKYKPDVILLDDGFQHRGIVRDLDIVIVDGRKLLPAIGMLPAGLRREPFSSLRRADFIVVTQDSGSTDENGIMLKKYYHKDTAIVQFRSKGVRDFELLNQTDYPTKDRNDCVAFCGIGNPDSFKNTLAVVGLSVKDMIIFPDHHRYSEADLIEIQDKYEKHKADSIITTEKDAMRLLSIKIPKSFPSKALYFLEIEAVVTDGEKNLHAILDQTIRGAA